MATPLNQSLLKGLEILALFTPERTEINTEMVVSATGMNAATAHRLLLTLQHGGALRSSRRGHFMLDWMISDLGRVAMQHNAVPQQVEDCIAALSASLNESVMVCRPGRDGPVCVAVAPSSRPITVNIRIGTMLPMLRSAQGYLWLLAMNEMERNKYLDAGLPGGSSARQALVKRLKETRRRGYAINLGDNESDIAALAVPVLNQSGQMVLTLSAFGMLSRFDKRFITRATRELKGAAAKLFDS